jgi:hypothetical protein
LGLRAQTALRTVFPEWPVEGSGNDAQKSAIYRVIEAQIAAACIGRKPLYFEPFGEDFATPLAKIFREVLPTGVEIHAVRDNLYIYRPKALQMLLDADPSFYRPGKQTDLEAIVRVSERDENGELLGYGARSVDEPGSVGVTLRGSEGIYYTFFASNPERAEHYGRERAKDISDYLNLPVDYLIDHNPFAR